jgi:hypothetical protein
MSSYESNEDIMYFFYGRPAYRFTEETATRIEAACPYCFTFDSNTISKAKTIFPFDSGAYAKWLYGGLALDDMPIQDFLLEIDQKRPNKIIAAVYSSLDKYFDGESSEIIAPERGAEPWEFHARAFLHLLASPGRNEPNDRISSIEIIFDQQVPLAGNLRALVVPHTLWDSGRAPWLDELHTGGVEIIPYIFIPGRHPQHYQALVESAVRDLYRVWGIL